MQQQRLHFLETKDITDDKRLFDYHVCGGATLTMTLYPNWKPMHHSAHHGITVRCLDQLQQSIDHEHAALMMTPAAARRIASGEEIRKPVHTVCGWATLFYAAYRGQREVCAALVRFGVDPSSRQPGRAEEPNRRPGSRVAVGVRAADGSGRSPLHAAAEQGHIGIVEDMLRAGANPCVADWDGATPEVLAKNARRYACAEALAIARWDIVQKRDSVRLLSPPEVSNDVSDGRTFSVAFLSTVPAGSRPTSISPSPTRLASP